MLTRIDCILAPSIAIAALLGAFSASSQAQTLTVSVTNPSSVARKDIPVAVALPQDIKVKSAMLSYISSSDAYTSSSGSRKSHQHPSSTGSCKSFHATSTTGSSNPPSSCFCTSLYDSDLSPLPYQLDDLNDDGQNDELFFLTDLNANETRTFTITLSEEKATMTFPPRVYTDMMLTNKKIKESNRQNLYISQLTVENGTNAYNMLHHHGAAFESELVAYRIYFDHRQTVDIYGKYHLGLELRQTQFYPDREQKAQGYGDDVLWVGNTLGVGTLRGWDGQQPLMLSDVEHRSQRLVATGPLRVIVEVKDRQWRVLPDEEPITMTTRYTLLAGHRDCAVDISFEDLPHDHTFVTGLINVKDSREYSNQRGLRGCWGTDWPVSAKDSVGHKRETVGLGIAIPQEYVVEERPADSDNYPIVVRPLGNQLHYDIVFGSENEDFGFHSADSWFHFLKEWYDLLQKPTIIKTVSPNA